MEKRPRDVLVRLSELRLRVRDWAGPSDEAPVVVLLHGMFGDAQMWDLFCPVLASRYRVITPDARGHGLSDWSPECDYSVECQVDDLAGLLDALQCETVDIVGASMGGVTAYNFAARYAQRVGRLVLVDVSPEVFAPRLNNQSRITALSEDRFASIEDAVATRSSVYRRPGDPRVREAIERNIMLLADGTVSWRYDLHWLAKSWLASGDADEQWQLLRGVAAPTLVLRGTESLVFPSDLAERVLNTLPTASLAEIPEAGHPIAMDQPALFLSPRF